LNTAKVRTNQTKPETYVPKRPVINDCGYTLKIHGDYLEDMKKCAAEQLRKAEQKEKEILVLYVEHYFGRQLTLTERRNLFEQAKKYKLIV
jgi:hypothetical protein